MSWRYTRGNVSVVVDDGLEQLIRKALDADPIIDALEEELDIIRSDIDAEWPVQSGESLRGWQLYIGVTGDTITARVGNTTSYTYYVKGKEHGGKQSFRVAVTKPALARVKALVKRIEVKWKQRIER